MSDIDLTDYAGRLDAETGNSVSQSRPGKAIWLSTKSSDSEVVISNVVIGCVYATGLRDDTAIALARLFANSPELLEIFNHAMVYVGETMFDVDKTNLERESAFALYNEMRVLVAKIEGLEKPC